MLFCQSIRTVNVQFNTLLSAYASILQSFFLFCTTKGLIILIVEPNLLHRLDATYSVYSPTRHYHPIHVLFYDSAKALVELLCSTAITPTAITLSCFFLLNFDDFTVLIFLQFSHGYKG